MIKQTLLALAAVGACLTPSAALAQSEAVQTGSSVDYYNGYTIKVVWDDEEGTHGPILFHAQKGSKDHAFSAVCYEDGGWLWVGYGRADDDLDPWLETYLNDVCAV